MQVLILDDESYILDYLKELINWKTLGFDKVITSNDVNIATNLLMKNTIDLMITDIRMPEKSGLDFIKEINQKNLKTGVIILSGYSEFEYARQAIIYGALDYLLKPVTKDIFQQAVMKAKHKIITKSRYKTHQEKDSERVLNFFLHGLQGTYPKENIEGIIDVNQKYCFLRIADVSLVDDEKVVFTVIDGEENICCMEVDSLSFDSSKITKQSQLFSFGNAEEFQRAFLTFFCDWEGNFNSLGDSRIKFLNYVDAQKLPETSFQDEFDECSKKEKVPFALHTLVSLELIQATIYSIQQLIQLLLDKENLFSMSMVLFDKYQRNYKTLSTSNQIVGFIKRYIDKHIYDDLNLNALAELVYLTPSYLSKVFKQVTNKTLSTYIVEQRMKTAALLLENTELKVSEIGNRLGYKKPQYFIKVFKDHYNKTPQNYRRGIFKKKI